MAKLITKRKKKRIKIKGLLSFALVITFGLTLYTRLFVRTENNNLMQKIQDTQKESGKLSLENQNLKLAVDQLKNYIRVVGIAQESGLNSLDNTITVRRGE